MKIKYSLPVLACRSFVILLKKLFTAKAVKNPLAGRRILNGGNLPC